MNRAEELAKMFVAEAIKYGKVRKSGDSRLMDKQSEMISKVAAEIGALGENEINILNEFLDYENEFVRLHTALILLKTETNKSVEVLTNLTKVRGPVAVEARIILSELKKGNL
ncbi:hypothetical protein [Clostridium saccharobutylicum]|uniref:DUF2019 domain-containing protein n=1 Tax=Clostridium saccharobutylicum TaxID=169679 RepID=A0A1S8MQ74_CLOSA|nr:hypothetical protein [Clostridium saccharobutylicum]OOM06321.1 hypothetical protein CLOSAC_42400 [Clostridium saccharobutylicum]